MGFIKAEKRLQCMFPWQGCWLWIHLLCWIAAEPICESFAALVWKNLLWTGSFGASWKVIHSSTDLLDLKNISIFNLHCNFYLTACSCVLRFDRVAICVYWVCVGFCFPFGKHLVDQELFFTVGVWSSFTLEKFQLADFSCLDWFTGGGRDLSV